LGFKPLQDTQKKFHREQVIFPYLKAIEKTLQENFNITIFGKPFLSNLNRLEVLYHKATTFEKFELTHIKELFEILFELHALELPNLHKQISDETIENLGNVKLFSSLLNERNDKRKKARDNHSFMSELLEYNLKQKQSQMEQGLKEQYDPAIVEKLLLLKQVKNSFDISKGKIKIKGTLAESMSFKRSFSSLYGYFILGLIITFYGLGVIIIANGLFSPLVFGALSPFLLLLFGPSTIFLFIYWNAFMRHKGE
jgi:hypothetical protein